MEPVSVASSFFSMIFALAIILGLLFAAVYFLKRFLPPSTSRFDNKIINIISTRYINHKNSIMIVEILGKVIVIGSSENQLSYLTEISDENTLERMERMRANHKPPSSVSMRDNRLYNEAKALLARFVGKEK
jgi:flagellar protein FliO/FliZ